MVTDEKFEQLLKQPENEFVDFKAEFYGFAKDSEKADGKLIMDILSFCNTVRTEVAYIVFGVKNLDGENNLVGINSMLDDATLQEKVKDKVFPIPKFISYTFFYREMKIGIIEIPIYPYKLPLSTTQKIKGGAKPNEIYLRRGSSNQIANQQEILRLGAWLEELNSLPIISLERPTYPEIDNYIRRFVSSGNDNSISKMFEKRITLADSLRDHSRIALLGWGLKGKSTELKALANELGKAPENYVYLISLANHVGEPIDSHLPNINQIPGNRIYVLLDGLDEILQTHYDAGLRLINQFAIKYPTCNVVVSCRTNIYNTNSDNETLNTLPGFTSVYLEDITYEQTQLFVHQRLGNDADAFLLLVQNKQLDLLLSIPYYLIQLTSQYKKEHQIAGSKAEIFRREINTLIRKEVAKRQSGQHEIAENRLFKIFERLAFVMEVCGTNRIKTSELSEVLTNSYDVEQITNAASLFFGTDGERKIWNFNHNNTQEFLAANVLADLPYSTIRKIIGTSRKYRKIKPNWVNTLSFLHGMLREDSQLKRQITEWMLRDNIELMLTLEPERVSDEVRFEVFKGIFLKYKKEQRHINRNIHRANELARFSESKEVLEFLLKEISSDNHVTSISNAIEVVNFFSFRQYSQYSNLFKAYYRDILLSDRSVLHHLALAGYCANFGISRIEFVEVFERFKDNENTWIRYQLFAGIWMTDSQDMLVDYVFSQAKFLIEEDKTDRIQKNGDVRLSNEYYEIANSLKHIKSEEALGKLLGLLENDFINFVRFTHYEQSMEVILESICSLSYNKEIFTSLKNILFGHWNELCHDETIFRSIFRYFDRVGKTNDILISFYNTIGFRYFFYYDVIARFITTGFIDFLLAEMNIGTFTKSNADALYNSLKACQSEHKHYFQAKFELDKTNVIQPPDYRKEYEDRQRQDLMALFDKKLQVLEVNKIFSAFGKDQLDENDISSNRVVDYWGMEYSEVARMIIDLRMQKKPIKQSAVVKRIQEQGMDAQVYLIFDFIQRRKEVNLTIQQQEFIRQWCDQSVKQVDFKKSIWRTDSHTWTHKVKAQILSFFLRYLDIKTRYDDSVYLDMLSFPKLNDSLTDIIPFVQASVGFEKTKNQIIQNLKENGLDLMMVLSYLQFLRENHVIEAREILLAHLLGDSSSNLEVLSTYVGIGGDVAALSPLFEKADTGYFYQSLIDKFIKAGVPFIKKYLIEQFNSNKGDDLKLFYCRYLFYFQSKRALAFYIRYIKKIGISPDSSTPGNPLFHLNNISLTWQMLNMYSLAQQPSYQSEIHNDLRSICSTALRNIALEKSNLPKFKRIVWLWIRQQKLKAFFKLAPNKSNLFKNLDFLIENFEKEFYVGKNVAPSRADAIKLYNAIKEKS